MLIRNGLRQAAIGALSYQIQDVGGIGGVVVSPLPLQKGAKLIAASADIAHVQLSIESTTERYMAEFMGHRFLGASIIESAAATDTSSAVLGWANENDA